MSLSNARSTTGGASLHYAAYFSYAVSTNLTLGYNDYYVSGTGGVPGYYNGADVTTVPLIAGTDASSSLNNPSFVNAGSTTASNYAITAYLTGVNGTGITTDFGSVTRGTTPTMGAWEMFRWTGSSSSAWGLAANWTGNSVPAADATIIFDTDPARDLQMDGDRSVTNIVNAQSADILITNGYRLTIKGNINFTNGAYIDATASSSTVAYAGTLAQTVEAGQYLNDKAYNLTIDNAAGVTLNSSFTVDNNMTINSGRIVTVASPNTLKVTGTLTNNGGNAGLVIKSGSNGSDAKLINNSSSVSATVELSLSGTLVSPGVARFHYVIPPVQSQTIGSTINEVKTNLGLTSFGGDLLAYDETKATPGKDNGWQYFDGYTWLGNPSTPFSTMVSSRGYNLYLTANDRATFRGTLNGAEHSFTLSYTGANPGPGWNLIGNPFPCNYDLAGVTELNNTDNVDNTVYFTRDGEFTYWNVSDDMGTSGYSDIVAPMQGFFIKARASASLTMPVASKTSTSAVPSRSKGAAVKSKGGSSTRMIKLTLGNGTFADETIVALFDDATTGFDGDHDAYKFFGTNPQTPYIYSEISSQKYAINAVSPPASDPVIIPLSVIIRTAGTYTISVTQFANLEGQTVTLKHGAIETKLSSDVSYTFTSACRHFHKFPACNRKHNNRS